MCPWLRRCIISLVVAVGLASSHSVSLAQSPQPQPDKGAAVDEQAIDSVHVTTSAGVIEQIAKCLANNQEAVLFTNTVDCVPYRKGKYHLKKNHFQAPFDFNSGRDCPPAQAINRPFNARHLSAETIRELAKKLDPKTAPQGIRIFRAIFCDKVHIVGLELPVSLVLDNSVFNNGIEIRNLRIKGDLSVDGSLVFKQLRILRSHIEGSLFGDKAFIAKLSVSNSTVDGSASFVESILFESAQFDDVTIARELSVRASALSYFITQFSKIGGLLDLSHSEARCAYHINKSEIGFLVAKRAGFGTVVPPPVNSVDKRRYYTWRKDFSDGVKRLYSSSDVATLISDPDLCVNEYDRTYRAELFVFDSNIKSSLCVSEIQWLAPHDLGPYTPQEFLNPRKGTDEYLQTVVAINGVTIGNNLIIDLWSPKQNSHDEIHDSVSERLHKFEAIGVTSGGLVIDFKDSTRKYFTAVDGLQFDRIYNAHATCEYGGSEKIVPSISEDRKLSIISDFRVQLELPSVDDVLKWLDLNEIGSTQPYTAFAKAFETAGLDSTPIKVARRDRELCGSIARWLPRIMTGFLCPEITNHGSGASPKLTRRDEDSKEEQTTGQKVVYAGQPSPDGGWSDLRRGLREIMSPLSDFAQLIFSSVLSLLADHGYRPTKVIWWIFLTLIGFWIIFLWPLGIIGYVPRPASTSEDSLSEEQKIKLDSMKPKPLGFSFLIDRFIPGYQISRTHYEIYRYYKRIPESAIVSGAPPSLIRRLFFVDWRVVQVVEDDEIAKIEKYLLVLRLLGLVYAIFLAAAVSALVVK